MVMALETWRVMVGFSLMALWYSVKQSLSVNPKVQGRHAEYILLDSTDHTVLHVQLLQIVQRELQ